MTITQRQLEILQGASQGKTMKEVAYDVGLSVRTVQWHSRMLLEALGANSITHAVAMGLRMGIIE